MNQLLSLDTQLFFLINHLPHTGLSNFIAEAFSGFGYSWMIWLIIGMILFIRKETKDHWFWVPLGIAALLCYGFSEVLFKNSIMRTRPDILASALIIGEIPQSYSFPSTHATVAFAYAYMFSRHEIHWIWMYILAFFIGVSRIYLGHHYPTDVIGGMLIGTLIGMGSMRLDDVIHKAKHAVVQHSSKRERKKL